MITTVYDYRTGIEPEHHRSRHIRTRREQGLLRARRGVIFT